MPLSTPEEPCVVCGRMTRHCPECGSSRSYGLVNESKIRSARSKVEINCVRCMSCNLVYEDQDMTCQAPAKAVPKKATKTVHGEESSIDPRQVFGWTDEEYEKFKRGEALPEPEQPEPASDEYTMDKIMEKLRKEQQ